MARLPRFQHPDVPLHAVVRGNDRRAIFVTEGDRIFFHRLLVELSRRYELEVHAYVLMTNHAHLLATPRARLAASRTFQALGRLYVPYFNRRQERTGTLWEGRFRSNPVAGDDHFFNCHRYIEMNPVRAKMIDDPAAYPWSSHRANLGLARDDLVTPHPLVLAMSASDRERGRAYRRLFDRPLEDSILERIRDCLNNGWGYGGDAWREEVEDRGGRRLQRVGPTRQPSIPRRSPGREHSDPSGIQLGQGTARIWAPA